LSGGSVSFSLSNLTNAGHILAENGSILSVSGTIVVTREVRGRRR
jgi:hypothetical protein